MKRFDLQGKLPEGPQPLPGAGRENTVPMGTAASWIRNLDPSKRKTGQYPVSPKKHKGISLTLAVWQ